MLEGLLTAMPKRLDVWSVYLDQEVRALGSGRSGSSSGAAEDRAAIRRLFQRVTASRQSSKKMRFLLKKWLAFEKQHGDAAGVLAVQAVAKSYVEAAAGGGASGAAGRGEEEEGEEEE